MALSDEALARLDQYIAEERLLRQRWNGQDGQGREKACLLAALVPQCGYEKTPEACPADLMPAWFAHLTPWIDDRGSEEAWPDVVRRYAALAHRWYVLDDAAWCRLDVEARRIVLVEATWHLPEGEAEDVRAVAGGALAVLGAGARGLGAGYVGMRRVVVEAATGAIYNTLRNRSRVAEVVSAVGRAAKCAMNTDSPDAVERAAAWAARSAAWATEESTTGFAEAAAHRAADRMTVAIFDAIEAACDAAEAAR